VEKQCFIARFAVWGPRSLHGFLSVEFNTDIFKYLIVRYTLKMSVKLRIRDECAKGHKRTEQVL
jgi:hypothetical protein